MSRVPGVTGPRRAGRRGGFASAELPWDAALLADPARLRPHAAVFHRAEAVAAQDGYSVELRELWSEDGELLTLNQQTIATIK